VRIRLAIPERHVDAGVLNAALEATTRANERVLEAGEAPLLDDAIRDGLVWKPEPFDDGEHFDLAAEATRRGWGDCDDLAPWHAAGLRVTGEDPGAEAIVRRTGTANRWHAVVRHSDGQIVDPSRMAGMGKGKEAAVVGALARPMARRGDAGMAVVPWRGGYAARADLPWEDQHVSSTWVAPTREEALLRAVRGACLVGDEVSCPHVDQALAVAGMLCEGDYSTRIAMAHELVDAQPDADELVDGCDGCVGDDTADAAGMAAAGACAAYGAPELAPVCSAGASRIVTDLGTVFGGKCTGWPCAQQRPEEWARWMKPAEIDRANQLFNAWLGTAVSTVPSVMAHASGPGGLDLGLKIPAGSMRRAFLSRWYQTFVEKAAHAATKMTAHKPAGAVASMATTGVVAPIAHFGSGGTKADKAQTLPAGKAPSGAPLGALPLPGGGSIAYSPGDPNGPIVIRF